MGDTLEIVYEVRPYEADYGNTMSAGALLNYLQDAAFAHAFQEGYSVYHLLPRGLTWVLTRYHVEVERLPAPGEKVTLRTWYPGSRKPYYLRDWEVLGGDGSIAARATSSWLIVDGNKRRPAEDKDLLEDFPKNPVRSLEDDFAPLPELEGPEAECRFMVRRSDTDLNRHVNHVHYIQWALDTIPEEAVSGKRVAGIEVGYRGEARSGDEVISRSGMVEDDGLFLHQLVRASDGRELTRLRTRWEKS